MIAVVAHRDVSALDELHRVLLGLGLRVEGLAQSLPELKGHVQRHRPDVVVAEWALDPELPVWLREVTALPGGPRVIVVTRGPADLLLWRQARAAGAIGVVSTRRAAALRAGLGRLVARVS